MARVAFRGAATERPDRSPLGSRVARQPGDFAKVPLIWLSFEKRLTGLSFYRKEWLVTESLLGLLGNVAGNGRAENWPA